jgi:hypothetical protein
VDEAQETGASARASASDPSNRTTPDSFAKAASGKHNFPPLYEFSLVEDLATGSSIYRLRYSDKRKAMEIRGSKFLRQLLDNTVFGLPLLSVPFVDEALREALDQRCAIASSDEKAAQYRKASKRNRAVEAAFAVLLVVVFFSSLVVENEDLASEGGALMGLYCAIALVHAAIRSPDKLGKYVSGRHDMNAHSKSWGSVVASRVRAALAVSSYSPSSSSACSSQDEGEFEEEEAAREGGGGGGGGSGHHRHAGVVNTGVSKAATCIHAICAEVSPASTGEGDSGGGARGGGGIAREGGCRSPKYLGEGQEGRGKPAPLSRRRRSEPPAPLKATNSSAASTAFIANATANTSANGSGNGNDGARWFDEQGMLDAQDLTSRDVEFVELQERLKMEQRASIVVFDAHRRQYVTSLDQLKRDIFGARSINGTSGRHISLARARSINMYIYQYTHTHINKCTRPHTHIHALTHTPHIHADRREILLTDYIECLGNARRVCRLGDAPGVCAGHV